MLIYPVTGRTASNWAKKICVWRKESKISEIWLMKSRNFEKLDFFSMVSDTRNKVVKQHIAGKILAMHCMSLLLKIFHFIVKVFSREGFWLPIVLLCLLFFSSNEPNGTRSIWAEKSDLRASSLVYLRWSSNSGLSLGCWNHQASDLSHFERGRELCLFMKCNLESSKFHSLFAVYGIYWKAIPK